MGSPRRHPLAAPAWALALTLAFAGCRSAGPLEPHPSETLEGASGDLVPLFDGTTAIQDQWRHLPIRGVTRWRLTEHDGSVVIRASGNGSASGLARWVELDAVRCPWLEWSWRVSQLQPSADLHSRAGDDVGAALFLLFGDPGMLSAPKRVPTLRYVWTNHNASVGDVIPNPYLPDTVKNVVVRSGTDTIPHFVTERRNLVQDFRRAFGTDPPDPVQALVLMTDNDQTREPVEASYAWARAHCTP